MRESICPCVLACVLAACQPHGSADRAASPDRQAAVARPDAANALQVSVDNAVRTQRLQPSRFEDKEPAPGDSFIVLDVSVRNPGHDTRVFNAGPLVLVAGGKEHRFDTPENIIADGYLLLEAVKPGTGVRGRIVYEVPSDLAGTLYWLPGNGQRLPVQASPTTRVVGGGDQRQVARATAGDQPVARTSMSSQVSSQSTPRTAVAQAATRQASTPRAPEPTPRASVPPASAARAPEAQPAAPTAKAGVAPAQLRELACRALVDNNDPAEQGRYRDFFHQQCKGYRTPRAWTRAAPAAIARATAPATRAGAAKAAQRAVAAEAPEPKPQVVASDSGPSFDCTQAAGRAEQLVCADALLSLLDRELAQAVSQAERKVADPTALLRDQDDWRARVRDACQTLPCLERAYTQRTAGLRAIGGFADVK